MRQGMKQRGAATAGEPATRRLERQRNCVMPDRLSGKFYFPDSLDALNIFFVHY
jgi:hypothetical protein